MLEKKLTTLVGLPKSEFDGFVKRGEVFLRPARLIPCFKPGDEMGLASVILSSLRLVREFRKMVLSAARMASGGQLYVYTEVTFPQFPESRLDGLILIVKGGTIRDAAICEMKNGKSELEKDQLERYQQIAKQYSIPRLITVSNQFVSVPTQCPIAVKPVKGVDLYHFSWSYLLTLAYVLLTDNDTNIADEDQVEIMREVVDYLEFDKSGVCGFNQMKKGWAETVEKVNAGALLRSTDPAVQETVTSWQQEERDIALILSRSLGVLVESGSKKHRTDLTGRLDKDTKELIEHHRLQSTLRVKGAVSDIGVTALFDKRTIEMHVSLRPPSEKKMRGQLGWLKRQLITCQRKDEDTFAKIKDELLVAIWLKNMRRPERIPIARLDDIYEVIKGKDIKEFRVICIKDFGKKFASRNKFVEIIEQMAIDFYRGVIQNLVRWEPTAPKMAPEKVPAVSDDDIPARPGTKAPAPDPAPVIDPPAPVEEIETAPCPMCAGNLILSTLRMGINECPHCHGKFEAG
jgi:hypothetical protein